MNEPKYKPRKKVNPKKIEVDTEEMQESFEENSSRLKQYYVNLRDVELIKDTIEK